jgi:hypothetical protein
VHAALPRALTHEGREERAPVGQCARPGREELEKAFQAVQRASEKIDPENEVHARSERLEMAGHDAEHVATGCDVRAGLAAEVGERDR